MKEELKWPITEDMVGTVVVFKGYRRDGHYHWKFQMGKVYTIEKHSKHQRFGMKDEDGDMPYQNYENTFMFEVVSLPKRSYFKRLINWLKGV